MLKQQFTEFSARPDNDDINTEVSKSTSILCGHNCLGLKQECLDSMSDFTDTGWCGVSDAAAEFCYDGDYLLRSTKEKERMEVKTKIGLRIKEYFGEDEVFDLSRPSTMYPEPVEEEVKPLYSRFVKAGEMHAVPPSITGTYMPTPYNLKTQDPELPPAVEYQDFASLMLKTKFHCWQSLNNVACVKSKAASVLAGSRNSSASVTAGGSDPAASRPTINSAGRPIPLEGVICRVNPSTDNDNRYRLTVVSSSSMTGNKEKLDDFVQVNGGIVKFGCGEWVLLQSPIIKTTLIIDIWEVPPERSIFNLIGCQVTSLNTSDYFGKFEVLHEPMVLVLWNANAEYAEEHCLSFKKEYEAKDAAARYGYLFSQKQDKILSQAEAEIRKCKCFLLKAPAVEVNPVPTQRVNTIHPQSQIIGDLASSVLTRSRAQKSKFGEKPSRIAKALEDPPIGLLLMDKMILTEQDVPRHIVRNKARLVAQGHRQEAEGYFPGSAKKQTIVATSSEQKPSMLLLLAAVDKVDMVFCGLTTLPDRAAAKEAAGIAAEPHQYLISSGFPLLGTNTESSPFPGDTLSFTTILRQNFHLRMWRKREERGSSKRRKRTCLIDEPRTSFPLQPFEQFQANLLLVSSHTKQVPEPLVLLLQLDKGQGFWFKSVGVRAEDLAQEDLPNVSEERAKELDDLMMRMTETDWLTLMIQVGSNPALARELLGADVNEENFIELHRMLPAITEPPSKRQRVDRVSSQPVSVLAATTLPAHDPNSAGGGTSNPAVSATPMTGTAAFNTAGGAFGAPATDSIITTTAAMDFAGSHRTLGVSPFADSAADPSPFFSSIAGGPSPSYVSTAHIPIAVLFESTSGGINEFFLKSDGEEQIGMSRVVADPDSDDEVLAEIIFRGKSISGDGVVFVDKLPDDEIVDPRVKVETVSESASSPPRSRRKHLGVRSDDFLWDKPVEDFFSSESESDDDMENYIPPLPYGAFKDWEIVSCPLGNTYIHVYYQENRRRKYFTYLKQLLPHVYREDLLLLRRRMNRYFRLNPEVDVGLELWRDVNMLCQSLHPDDVEDFWRTQDEWIVSSWKLYPKSSVHVLDLTNGKTVYMFVDKFYPIRATLLERMLRHRLIVPPSYCRDVVVAGNIIQTVQAGLRQAYECIASAPIACTTRQMVFSSPWLTAKKEFGSPLQMALWLVQEGTALGKDLLKSVDGCQLASPEQTATSKDVSNPLYGCDSLPKTVRVFQFTLDSRSEKLDWFLLHQDWKLLFFDVATSFDSAVHLASTCFSFLIDLAFFGNVCAYGFSAFVYCCWIHYKLLVFVMLLARSSSVPADYVPAGHFC
ncbi:hypothetical protein Tco_1054439 [Tanacetum coccineum]|uniref:Uncharacterized protein n=1 Tax=Tanacetum coccineum TaxID=301880 RepID=A0ABQ5GYP0_9ASTR